MTNAEFKKELKPEISVLHDEARELVKLFSTINRNAKSNTSK